MDIVAERIFEEMSAAGTAHALPLNFKSVPQARRPSDFTSRKAQRMRSRQSTGGQHFRGQLVPIECYTMG